MTIQEFDLPARWRTLLLENYSEAIHNLEVTWPDVQSLSVSYRDIESFDPDFALSIIEDQIRQRIKDTNFQNAKIIKTSVKNDTGLDILKNEILHLSKNIQKGQDRGMFYMPVDRVFSKKGFGTIVTGTVLSGRLEKNSEIDVFPGDDIGICLLYTSPSPRDQRGSRMPSSA